MSIPTTKIKPSGRLGREYTWYRRELDMAFARAVAVETVRRLQGEGLSLTAAARALGIAPSCFSGAGSWEARYKAEGLIGLVAGYHTGRGTPYRKTPREARRLAADESFLRLNGKTAGKARAPLLRASRGKSPGST